MTINWGLLGSPPDIAGRFREGWDRVQNDMRRSALEGAAQAYAANPRDPNALGALAAASPQFAVQLGAQRGRSMDAEDERRRVGSYFQNPDLGAARAQALQGGDIETAKLIGEMDDQTRKQLGDMYKAAGGIALGALKLPYEQRKAYINTNAPMLKASGWTDDQIAQFDPSDQALDGMVRYSTEVTSLLPKTVSTVPGGGVMSIDALSGDVDTLVAPNPGGIPMGTPVGDAPPPPPPGFTLDNPGGPTPSASGTFR
jgi:hypothetical protein